MFGTTRGLATLIGGLTAGILIWRAAATTDAGVGGYWTVIALAAGAGLSFGLAQQVTSGNVGFHRRFAGLGVAPGMFLLGFLPLAVIGSWFLLAADPGWWGAHVAEWSADLGIGVWVATMTTYAPLIAFGLGATLALSLYNEIREPEIVEEAVVDEAVVAEPVAEEAVVVQTTPAASDEEAIDRDLSEARDRVREPVPVEAEVVAAGPDDGYSRSELRREAVAEERT